jgi:methionyl-tRNA formyltransferase
MKLRVLLIGKHELACHVLDVVRAFPGIEVGCLAARREDADRRPTLSGRATLTGVRNFANDTQTALADAVDGFRPDLLISAGYDRIVRGALLTCVPRCINIHFGMLPKYRGSFSIPWAILNDEPKIGVTLHDMAPSIDDGPIIRQEEFANDHSRSCRELYDCAVQIGAKMAAWFVEGVVAGNPPGGTPQEERLATYYSPEYPAAFKVTWRQTVTYVANYIRAAHFPPYEGAFSTIDGYRIGFEWPVEWRFGAPGVPPGTVVAHNGMIGVAAVNGILLPGPVRFAGVFETFASIVTRLSLCGRVLE